MGIVALLIGLVLIGVGTQAKRESAEEQKIGMPAAKFSGAPFYVIGVGLVLLGVLLLTGVINFHGSFT